MESGKYLIFNLPTLELEMFVFPFYKLWKTCIPYFSDCIFQKRTFLVAYIPFIASLLSPFYILPGT